MKIGVKITTPATLLYSNMAEKEDKSNPKKGILKFETEDRETPADSTRKKSTKWDEMNIIATLHPPDKDYGHIKIDEPDTPYNYDTEPIELDPEVLSEKILQSADKPLKALQTIEDTEEDDTFEGETSEERLHKEEFENKRKAHYNEYIIMKQVQEKKDAGPSEDSSSAYPKRKEKREINKKYEMKKELFLTSDAQGSKEKCEEKLSLINNEREIKEKDGSSPTSYKQSIKEKYATSSTPSGKQLIKGRREYSKTKQVIQETHRESSLPKEKKDHMKEKRDTSKSKERK